MDTAEAKVVIADRLATLRSQTRAKLEQRVGDPEHAEIVAPSGATYQVETQAMWDDTKNGNLRVMVSVDDGGWRSIAPLSDDFIVAPDGSFIGE
jgi:hypothetical protein